MADRPDLLGALQGAIARAREDRRSAPSLGAGSAEDVEGLAAELVRLGFKRGYAEAVAPDLLASPWLAAHVARASTADRERVAAAVIGVLKPYGFGDAEAVAIADRIRAALAAPHVEREAGT